MTVRTAVESGNFNEAIEKVNDLINEAIIFAQQELAQRGEENVNYFD